MAQALDPKSIIALSQYPDVDLRFFLPVKFPNRRKRRNLFVKLRSLLSQMPLETADAATKYFTELALKIEDGEGVDAIVEDEDVCGYAGW